MPKALPIAVLEAKKESEDPLKGMQQAKGYAVSGLERNHWSTASQIRTVFCEAFVSAGLPYFNPHSFRNTLVQLGQDVCKTPEQFKAWSQNLGHEKVLTTFLSYGTVACQRQGEIIRDLAIPPQAAQSNVSELAKAIAREMLSTGVGMQVK